MSWSNWLGAKKSESIERLMDTFVQCHQSAAVKNNNSSAVAIRLASSSGAEFSHALSAGLLTFGSVHGPAPQARWMLYSTDEEAVKRYIETVRRVPGFGNSFHKDDVDPSFSAMVDLIRDEYADHDKNLMRVRDLVREIRGKNLHQNPAAYTAICAQILGMPPGTELMLAIGARLPSWAAIWARERMGMKE